MGAETFSHVKPKVDKAGATKVILNPARYPTSCRCRKRHRTAIRQRPQAPQDCHQNNTLHHFQRNQALSTSMLRASLNKPAARKTITNMSIIAKQTRS